MTASSAITIRTDIRPGDLGHIIHRHGTLYSGEYGYSPAFEMYVAQGMTEFYRNYDPSRDCAWICEDVGRIIGFLLLMHRSSDTAQLRFFYLEPAYRGQGLGRRLMDLFMEFLSGHGYNSCYLWTTHEQVAAAALYEKYGFRLAEEKQSGAFGKQLTEQKYIRFSGGNGPPLKTISDLLLLGDPRLHEISSAVTPADLSLIPAWVADLDNVMKEIRAKYNFGRGIAAPQLGIPKRLIYLNIDRPVIILNPEFTFRSDEMFDVWDDCMCFPNLLVRVSRHRRVTVQYLDESFQPRTLEASDALSELLQHETDHLDGVLCTMRAAAGRSFRWR